MDSLLDDIARLEAMRRLREACDIARHGFVPYGVAMHPVTYASMLRSMPGCKYIWSMTETMPDTFNGMPVFRDWNIEVGSVEIISEEKAKERYGGRDE